jgi:hypothetical protein
MVNPHALSVAPMNMLLPAKTPVPPNHLNARMVPRPPMPVPATPILGLIMTLKIV